MGIRLSGRAFPAFLSMAFGLLACGPDPTAPFQGGDPPSELQAATITTNDNFRFMEEVTMITQGVPVRWISKSGLRHTVTPVGHAEFEKVEVEQRGVVMLEVEFEVPGEYEFRCDNHWQVGMVGRVIVLPR